MTDAIRQKHGCLHSGIGKHPAAAHWLPPSSLKKLQQLFIKIPPAATSLLPLPANAHKRKVTGIAGRKGFSNVYVEKSMMNGEIGFVAKLLEIFAGHGIPFEHCPSGIDTVSIIVSTAALASARKEILQEIDMQLHPDHVSVEDGLALIAVVGQGMIYAKGTAAHIFHVIADANINIRMIDQGSSELNIIIAVKEADYELAIRSLYRAVERML